MQYIITKYLGHTEHKPARVKAKQSGGPYSVTVSVGPEDTHDMAELKAVNALRKRLGWKSLLFRAGQHQGGSVWCFTPETHEERPSGCTWADGEV
jgi:hypothetical protein